MKLTINNQGFFKNLQSVFSESSSLVSELIQNGRRAGAQSVRFEIDDGVLSVLDDGCGIDDFGKLLCIAESGWSDSVSTNENPYGMGAMAMLFAGRKVVVKSKGKSFTIDTEAALSGKSLGAPEEDTTAPLKGTLIQIHGFTLTEQLSHFIRKAALCSSIPVYFNGDLVPSPYSYSAMMKTGNFEEYDVNGVGKILFYKKMYMVNSAAVVVQDMNITGNLYDVRHWHGDFVVFSTNELAVRMPDRNGLIDQDEQLAKIILEAKKINKVRLSKARKEMGDDQAFFNKCWKAVLKEYPEMFMTVDFLPSDMFNGCEYPTCNHDLTMDSVLFSKAGVSANSDVLIISNDHYHREVIQGLFLFYSEAIELCSGIISKLPKQHWIHSKLYNPTTDSFTVRFKKKESGVISLDYHASLYKSPVLIGEVVIASESLGKEVDIPCGIDITECHENSIPSSSPVVKFEGFDATNVSLLVGVNGCNFAEKIIRQGTSYATEGGDNDELAALKDAELLELQLSVILGEQNGLSVLQRFIEQLPASLKSSLNGRSFLFELNNETLVISEGTTT